jgi:outer membrane protein
MPPPILTLERAFDTALRGNPDLRAAEARFRQAEERVRQARAEYQPSLDTSITATARRDIDNPNQSLASLTGSPISKSSEDYRGNISASWLVFDGLGRRYRNRFAEFGAQQSEAGIAEARRLILGNVATAYFNVQLERENIAIADADRDFNARQLDEARARERAGTGPLSDVLNFEVRIRAAESSLIQARRNYRVSVLLLLDLLGVGDTWSVDAVQILPLETESDTDLIAPDRTLALDYARDQRPDIKQALYSLEQAGVGVSLTRSGYWPSLSAFTQGDASRNTGSSFSDDETATSISAGLQLNYNIYSGGRRRAQVRESRAREEEAEFFLRAVELQAIRDVEIALQNLITAQEQLRLQRETTQYVEQNRDLVEKEYRAGQGSLVRLNEAQRDLIAQQARLALARAALFERWYGLRTATGEIVEKAVRPAN